MNNEIKEKVLEFYLSAADQAFLAAIAHDLIVEDIPKEEAAQRILQFVDNMSERQPVLLEEMEGSTPAK